MINHLEMFIDDRTIEITLIGFPVFMRLCPAVIPFTFIIFRRFCFTWRLFSMRYLKFCAKPRTAARRCASGARWRLCG